MGRSHGGGWQSPRRGAQSRRREGSVIHEGRQQVSFPHPGFAAYYVRGDTDGSCRGRTDKKQTAEDKVKRVEGLLAAAEESK